MPAEVYEAQVIFANVNGLPEDQYVNTWHFQDPDGTGDLADLNTTIQNFYNDPFGADPKPATLLSGRISRVADSAQVKIYRLSDAPPRVPLSSDTWTPIAAGTVQNLPEEVALCMSFRGQLVSGTNPARRRGRIFLGPLCRYAAESTAGQEDRPEVDNFSHILDAAQRLHDAAQTYGFDWGIWSRAGAEFTPAAYVWIDNAFDTQRRRGAAPTARTSHVLT